MRENVGIYPLLVGGGREGPVLLGSTSRVLFRYVFFFEDPNILT